MEVQEDKNTLDFVLNGIEAHTANSLRRVMISQIPSVVIENVCIKEYDGHLGDEMIVHRLGLIPLKRTEESKDSEEKVFRMEISETGPKVVYSRDIKFDEGIEVVDPDIIILNLKKGEKLELFGFTEEGIAFDHSKFCVCATVSYEMLLEDSFKFHIETCGNYTAKEVFVKAIDILKEELLAYKKLV